MSRPQRPIIYLGLLFFLALLVRIIPQPRTVDDAFITFRYSRNLANGDGFVYNPDSEVLGTTTPLYTVLIAGCGVLFGDDNYPSYALGVNAVADSISVVLLVWLGAYLTKNYWAGIVVGGIWSIAPYSVTFAIGGMETSLHNLFMIAAWVAYLSGQRRGWVGALVALGLLTRPDALIWAAPLMIHQGWTMWCEHNKLPWRDYLIGLMIGLPWAIFATLYFGSPFPHTVGTKSLVYKVDSLQAFLRLLQHYTTPFQQHELLGAMPAILIGLFLFPSLALIGLRASLRATPHSLPIMVYPWLYFAVFAILNPLIFRWYLCPLLPAYYLGIVSGVYALLKAFPISQQQLRAIGAGLALVVLGFLVTAWELHPDHGPDRPAPKMAFHELELNYEKMAERLVNEQGVNADTWVAVGDIGVVGFYTNARILDTIGLVTKDLEDYYSQELQDQIVVDGANYAIPPEMIFEKQPEYLVVMVDFITLGLNEDPRFAAQYELIYMIETDYYGGQMLAYRRRSEQPPNNQP